MLDGDALLFGRIEHNQIVPAAASRAHQNRSFRAAGMCAGLGVRLYHRPRLVGNVAGALRQGRRARLLMPRARNLLPGEGARVDALVREDEHIAVGGKRG